MGRLAIAYQVLIVLAGYAVAFVLGYPLFRRRNRPPTLELTLGDLVAWSTELETAAQQVQKAYDWRIAQWSAFGNAVLTATLAFVSAAAVEAFKGTIGTHSLGAVAFGTFSSLLLYWISQLRVTRLRREFLALYGILVLLH